MHSNEQQVGKILKTLRLLTAVVIVGLIYDVVYSLVLLPKFEETMEEIVEDKGFDDAMMELVERNKLDEVIEKCNARGKERPNDINVYYYRGLAHYYKDEKAKSVPDFERVIELDPSWSESVSGYLTEAR